MSQFVGSEAAVFHGPKSLAIMPTFQCTAHCAQCGTFSSPQDRTSLPLETTISAIDQAKDIGFCNVVFTGGEPTLRWKDLLAAIAHAHDLGLPTRIVTNAFWAATPQKAAQRIAALIEAGLHEINFSTGDEHCKYVPPERVVNAIVAAVRRGLRTHVMVELRTERRVTEDAIFNHAKVLALTPEQRELLSVSDGAWTPMDPMRVADCPPSTVVREENIAAVTGCDSVLQTYLLMADGRIGACCGLGMRMIPELSVAYAEGESFMARAVEEAEADLLKLGIRYVGPEAILAWAAEKDATVVWENMYAHRCQACLRLYHDPAIRKEILAHHAEILPLILQNMWFDEEFTPRLLNEAMAESAAQDGQRREASDCQAAFNED